MRRSLLERLAAVIDACPDVYTRVQWKANVTSAVLKKVMELGLIQRKLGPNDNSYSRKMVYWTSATEKGKEFSAHIRAAVKLLGGDW